MIPMIDLGRQFREIREELLSVVSEILESSQYILGPKVHEFERRVSEYIGVAHSIGVASGTDALHLAIAALDIREGDEVITTPFTFFATVEAILYTGGKPVFVDIELPGFGLDCSRIEERITAKTKAILPVHLFGRPCDMGRIMDIARKHNLFVIEDCAQAFGASFQGKKVGGFGNAGCFSFYPSKNLGAFGDGGMITLNGGEYEEVIRSLRNHGSKGAYLHDAVGFNSRLDEMQAGILLVKLKRIDEYNLRRRQKAAHYTSLLSGSVACPTEADGTVHVYNQYTIISRKRDEIQKQLRDQGIASVVYYPRPLHLQKALSFLGYRQGDFPVTEQASREVLSLPLYPELEEENIEKIAGIVKSVGG